jgi:hypothetical protein
MRSRLEIKLKMMSEQFDFQIPDWNEHGSKKTFQHSVNYDFLNQLLPRMDKIHHIKLCGSWI